MALKFSSNAEHSVDWMRERPIAHRGLHDTSSGIFENTIAAAKAAVEGNYHIEVDLQPSSDKVPMAFHDFELERLTDQQGETRSLQAAELNKLTIGGTSSVIPTLEEFLSTVDGQVGVVLELKGKKGADDGFVPAVARALEAYSGPSAIMSFHHHILDDARKFAPHLPLGLTAYGDDNRYTIHQRVAERCNVDFLSYELANLDTRFVADFRKTGRTVISWTVKSRADAARSAKYADQITFEGFRA